MAQKYKIIISYPMDSVKENRNYENIFQATSLSNLLTKKKEPTFAGSLSPHNSF
jgi:hypothetical protein